VFACGLPSKIEGITIDIRGCSPGRRRRRNLRKIPPSPIREGEACFQKRRRNSVSFGDSIRSQ